MPCGPQPEGPPFFTGTGCCGGVVPTTTSLWYVRKRERQQAGTTADGPPVAGSTSGSTQTVPLSLTFGYAHPWFLSGHVRIAYAGVGFADMYTVNDGYRDSGSFTYQNTGFTGGPWVNATAGIPLASDPYFGFRGTENAGFPHHSVNLELQVSDPTRQILSNTPDSVRLNRPQSSGVGNTFPETLYEFSQPYTFQRWLDDSFSAYAAVRGNAPNLCAISRYVLDQNGCAYPHVWADEAAQFQLNRLVESDEAELLVGSAFHRVTIDVANLTGRFNCTVQGRRDLQGFRIEGNRRVRLKTYTLNTTTVFDRYPWPAGAALGPALISSGVTETLDSDVVVSVAGFLEIPPPQQPHTIIKAYINPIE